MKEEREERGVMVSGNERMLHEVRWEERVAERKKE